VYRAIEELRADLDEWMRHCNEARTHQGRWCFGNLDENRLVVLPVVAPASRQLEPPANPGRLGRSIRALA